MTLQEILNFVNYVANKEQQGLSLSPEQYNSLLIGFNVQLFQSEIDAVEVAAKQAGTPVYRLFSGVSSLRPFRKFANLTTDVSGVAPLPTDYVHYMSLTSLFNGTYRDIDVITEEDMANRRTSLMETPLSIKPACTMYGTSAKFYPSTVGHAPNGLVELSYIKKPSSPYYDYCVQKDTGVVVYMPVGSVLRYLGSAVWRLEEAGGTIIASNVYYYLANPNQVSKTVELEWDERFHPVFIRLLLDAMGLNLDQEKLRTYMAQAK